MVALCASPGLASAVTYTWKGGVSQTWATAGNWVGNSVPISNAATNLIFGANLSGAAINNNISTPFVMRSLTFNSNAPEYTFSG